MIGRRALLGGLLASASAAGAQSFRLGRAPGFRSGLRFPAVTALAYTTWNPADKSVNFSLSTDKLTINGNANTGTARTISSKTAGKYYWEWKVTNVTAHNSSCGLASASASLNVLLGQDGSGIGYLSNGVVLYNNSSIASYPNYTSADVAQGAWDAQAGRLWFGKNGVFQGSPNAGTGFIDVGSLFAGGTPLFVAGGPYDGSLTANFGATPFTYAPPTGFTGFTT